MAQLLLGATSGFPFYYNMQILKALWDLPRLEDPLEDLQ